MMRIGMCLVAVSGGVMVGGVVGCSGKARAVSDRSELMASYSWGTLSVDLEGATPVLTLRAAAEAALRSRGYSIESVSATAEWTSVRAKRPGAGLFDAVVVGARVVKGGSRVTVKVEPLGDEEASRAVMDQILASLGR